MPDRRIGVVLTEGDVQEFLRVVMDSDPAAALEFLERVVRPQVEVGLRPLGCGPVFELPRPEAGSTSPTESPQGKAKEDQPEGA
jgi:hypothetical protein